MTKALKTLHLLGLALFLGSIPGHVLLGRLAAAASPGDAALLAQAKHLSTLALTLPGLGLVVASGIGLLLARPERLRAPWMRVKLGLVALVAANGVFLLSPIGAGIARLAAEAAASGAIPPELGALVAREGLLGAANLVMILAIVVLAVARPGRSGVARQAAAARAG